MNVHAKRMSMPYVSLAAMLATSQPSAVLGCVRSEGGNDIRSVLSEMTTELSNLGDRTRSRMDELEARSRDIEQVVADLDRSGRHGGGRVETPGARFIQSDAFRGAGSSPGRVNITAVVNSITSLSTSAGAMIPVDHRPEIVGLPKRRLTVRALIAPGRTTSNLVQYARQTTRTNNAAVVSEGAQKPESVYAWEQDDAPVRTIAHWVPVSRQAMDDADLLMSTIDGELRYGLNLTEEAELLSGSGSGEHIHGIIPQATAYETARDSTGDTRFDTLAHALAQSEVALLPATGIVMNIDDLEALKLIKDGEGRYIGGGPFGPPITTIWGRAVVGTPAMTEGSFLVGAFLDGAQIFDRMDAEVLVSSEDRDNFIKNMLTCRGEQRLAMAVKRPAAFIHGTFAN